MVTDEILYQLPEVKSVNSGLLVLTLQHTSASLSLNENADPTVRSDLESIFNRLVPENQPDYHHTFEGPDDLPAHVKSAILGVNLSISVQLCSLVLGTWQGIFLGEHRNNAGSRKISATLMYD